VSLCTRAGSATFDAQRSVMADDRLAKVAGLTRGRLTRLLGETWGGVRLCGFSGAVGRELLVRVPSVLRVSAGSGRAALRGPMCLRWRAASAAHSGARRRLLSSVRVPTILITPFPEILITFP